jgi:hypothetical protein
LSHWPQDGPIGVGCLEGAQIWLGPIYYPADLATHSVQRELTRQLAQELPHVDMFVLNAAMHVAGPIEDASLSDFDKLY